MSGLETRASSGAAGLPILVVTAVAAIAARLLIGRGFDEDGLGILVFGLPESSILEIRVSAVAAASVAGAALALSGLAFQVLLRNPLASPWVLGVSGGAGFGIMLAAWLARLGGAAGLVGGWLLAGAGMPAAAAGAILAILIVWGLARRLGGYDPVGLVLCGVVTSATFGAGILFLQHLVPNGVRGDLVGWLMGRVPELESAWLIGLGALAVLSALGLGWWAGPAIDAASLGEDEARSVGVPIDELRRGLLATGGVLAAIAVVIVGPIAFVGLLAPHFARVVCGPRHRGLVWSTAIAGVAILVGADSVRQLVDLGGGRLPVGVLTALVGGPVFLLLLLRDRRRS